MADTLEDKPLILKKKKKIPAEGHGGAWKIAYADFVTAMITSFQYVSARPVLLLGWGAFLAALVFLAMLPGFLGLLVALPVAGHASWHLYALAKAQGSASAGM